MNISLNELTAHPIFCLQLAENLAKLGKHVTLYVPKEKRTVNVDFIEAELGFPIHFHVDELSDRFFGRRSLRLFFYYCALKAFFNKTDLLWTFEPYSVQLARILRIPSVIEIHSSLPSQRFLKVAKMIQTSNLVRLFIANSQAHCKVLEAAGLTDRKLFAAHNALTDEFLGRGRKSRENLFRDKHQIKERIIVTYSGSLYRGRGVEEIVKIAPELPECAFVIFGGPERERMRFVQEIRSSNVYFMGSIPHREVPAYLSASDILLALYNEDCVDIGGNKTIQTASPMKLFEYMASGVPIITSNIGAIPEIIENSRTGILIDPNDLASLKDSIKLLITNRNLAGAISRAAEKEVRKYTWSHRLKRCFRLINSPSV